MGKIKGIDKNLNINKDSLSGIDYPVFCFKHLQSDSIKECKDHDFFFKFLERLQKLSSLGWKVIHVSDKHGFGTEKLPIGQIKPKIPAFITPDVKHLSVFRANGNNLPFIGHRNGNLFHIIFIESNFGDIYNHN